MTRAPNAQDLNINPARLGDLIFVPRAKIVDLLNRQCTVRHVPGPSRDIDEIEQVLPQLFPALHSAHGEGALRVARRWAGLMAFTADYLPIADRVPGLPNAWVVGGFCGHGMPFGMRLGQLLAQ